MQNHPNPFSPITTIGFSIPATEEVSLKIFTILGEEIATLMSGRLAPGTYSAQWDDTDWPSGAYLYRLKAGDFVLTKRLILLR